MKYLKYFICFLVINVLLVNVFIVNAEEKITKDGNKTIISLEDDLKGTGDNIRLFGSDPPVEQTANFQLVRGGENLTNSETFVNGNSRNTSTYVASSWTLKDSNQNKATISQINKFKMTQDDDYYYFDFDIDYETNNVTMDDAISINGGEIYLSNKANNNIMYEHQKSGSGSYYADWRDGVSKGSGYSLSNTESLELSINNTQMKQTGSWVRNGTSGQPAFNPTGTIDGDTENAPSSTYCTYDFMFKNYIDYPNYTSITNSLSSYYANTSKYKATGIPTPVSYKQYAFYYALTTTIFSNGNYIYPITPTYNMIDIEENNVDTTKEFWNNNIKGKITIKKEDIENYKYLNMYAPTGVITNYTNNLNYSGKSIHSDISIELTEYAHCEHNWIKRRIDDNSYHEQYCTKCEWTHREPHNFEYEYDGFTNNLCECGQNININHHYKLNSNDISELDVVVNSNSDYVKYNNLNKTGYNLDYFKKYEKQFENMVNPVFSVSSTSIVERFVGNVATMSDISGNFSTTYEAIYKPIKYNIHFDTTNNMGLVIPAASVSDLNNLLYDTEYNIPVINVNGYAFDGYTTTNGGNVAEFEIGKKFKNLTSVDGATITLYPVFDHANYKFVFHKENNLDLEITTDIPNLKCYMDTNYTLTDNISITGYNFKGWSLTFKGNSIDFTPNQQLYNYTSECVVYNLYPVYEANKYTFNYSNENNVGQSINGNIVPQEFKYNEPQNLKNHIKIYGYKFNGWSLIASSSNVDFTPNQEILNYTTINNDTITIYPVYEELSFTINYTTNIGKYSNNQQTITKEYKVIDLVDFEKPHTDEKVTLDNKGNIFEREYYAFINYTDENGNSYTTINNIKDNVFNNEIVNYIINLTANLRFCTWRKPSSSSDSGGNGKIDNIPIDNEQLKLLNKILTDNNDTIKISISSENNKLKINSIEPKNSSQSKDIIDLLNEIFADWSEQNNISNNINDEFEIDVYTNKDIIDLLNEIFADWSNKNHKENDNMVIGFTNTKVAGESPATFSFIREVKKETNTEKIKDNEYIAKIFDTKNTNKVNNFLNDLNNRNFNKIYKDLSNEYYNDVIEYLLKKYKNINKELNTEIKQKKYIYLLNNINNKIEDNIELDIELKNINENYIDEYNEILELIKSGEYTKLIENIKNGDYIDLFNEYKHLIESDSYNDIKYDILSNIINGDYTDDFYNLIYNILDITYNYEPPVEETIKKVTTPCIASSAEITKDTKLISNTNNNSLPIIPIIAILIAFVIILTIFLLIKNKKKEEQNY